MQRVHFPSTAAALLAAICLGAPAPAHAEKTAKVCKSEYKGNKAAIKATKETEADFVKRCRALPANEPTPIQGVNAGAPAPAPAPAPPAPTPAPAPAPAPAPTPSKRTQAPAAPGESACGNGYAHLPASHTAVQFCDEGQAKARCPGAAVVWVNTKSKVYHKAGANTYGHTKEGAYMCESDATAEGDRASKNGH